MMKKAFFMIIVVLGVVSLASCTKEYHCTCTYNNNVVYSVDLGVQYQNTAQTACSRYDSTLKGIIWNCTLH